MTTFNARTVAIAFGLFGSSIALAGELTKEECLDAHSRGQDAKEQGKLSLARKLFLTCAQSACPSLVQGDCARFADDLTRLQPSLTFAARDRSGTDLPDTTVYVDDVLVVTRLDGKPHDVDPGNHVVRFANAGRDVSQTIVVGSGEKGRSVVGTFAGGASSAPVAPSSGTSGTAFEPRTAPPAPKTTHPAAAKVTLAIGGALAIGGSVLGFVGLARVPGDCSVSTHQCAAPPGDPTFGDAAKNVRLSNLGFITAAVGAAVIAGGLVWYVKGAKTPDEAATVAMPWVSPDGAGIAISGRL